MSKGQVEEGHYLGTDYNNPGRWTSFSLQYRTAAGNSSEGDRLLEVGPGNKVFSHMIREAGREVTTVDVSEDVEPSVVADVRDLPFDDGSYDLVCAFEVLEHIPFEDFGTALKELRRVSKGKVLISIPHRQATFRFSLKLPMVQEKTLIFHLPLYRFISHEFDGQHHWEMGKKQYPKKKVESVIQKSFNIQDSFINQYNPNHRFYVLK